MIRKITIAFYIMSVVSSAGIAFAGDIFKWTDEDGNVHFGDRPTGEPSEERLKVSYNRTDAEALDLRVQSEREVADSLQESRAAATEEKRVVEEERLAAEENQARCESSRAKLNAKRTAQRLYRTDEAGERVFLDDAQRAESIAKSESAIKENCGR